MSKWNGNIISKDARYRTQTSSQARGIYSLDEQLQHRSADNWTGPINIGIDTGYHFANLTLITDSTSNDDDTNFSVATVPMPDGASQGRLYLAHQITSGTPTYQNDFCIGSVQIPHNNGADLNTTTDTSTNVNWNMHNTTYGAHSWQRASSANINGSNNTVSSTSGYSWSNINSTVSPSSTINKRWAYFHSTGSTYTGAANGINYSNNIFSTLGDLSPSGNSPNRLPQVDNDTNTYYIYSESSGTSQGHILWCRSPEVTLTGSNHIVVIAYLFAHAGNSVNTVSEPLLRVFWDES